MKTIEQILEYKGGSSCNCIDGRDMARLADFIPLEHWEKLGLTLAKGVEVKDIITKPLTQENVLNCLKDDLSFAFKKALNRRGISSSLMYDVILMWLWVLDDKEFDNWQQYAQYGLPLYKAVAVKYNLDNPIGEDVGDEPKYASCD